MLVDLNHDIVKRIKNKWGISIFNTKVPSAGSVAVNDTATPFVELLLSLISSYYHHRSSTEQI